jgi:hypothetical protein
MLLLLYHAAHKDLAAIWPLGKFLCIKVLVFLSWWQACAISLLVERKDLHANTGFAAEQVANATQNMLICMEMFLASIAYHYVFPVSDFASPEVPLALASGVVGAGAADAPEVSVPRAMERRTVAYAVYASCLPTECADDARGVLGCVCRRLGHCLSRGRVGSSASRV